MIRPLLASQLSMSEINQGGAGAGRTITADSGAVTIDGSDGLTLDSGSLLQLAGDPMVVGSLGIGQQPVSVYVSGRYAYVVDVTSDDLKTIDISDPSAPSVAGILGRDTSPSSVYVTGRYAYVIDSASNDLKVIDVSGAEISSLMAHSLEAGNLQVRNDFTAQGRLQVTGGINVGAGGLFTDGNVGVSGTLAIANDIAPTSSPANLVQLYAAEDGGNSELYARDEAGNVSLLSPHNFSLTGGPSEPMAWSFYSENDHGSINVDMLRTVRLVERTSGQKPVYTEPKGSGGVDRGAGFPEDSLALAPSLIDLMNELRRNNELLRADNEALKLRVVALEARLD